MPKIQLMEDDWRELRARLLEETKGFAHVPDAVDHVLMEFGMGHELTGELDATRTSDALRDLQRLGQECEREPDRLAVVCSAGGYTALSHLTDARPIEWDRMEAAIVVQGGKGPFRRQIVRAHLLRPETVAEVEGVTEDA